MGLFDFMKKKIHEEKNGSAADEKTLVAALFSWKWSAGDEKS